MLHTKDSKSSASGAVYARLQRQWGHHFKFRKDYLCWLNSEWVMALQERKLYKISKKMQSKGHNSETESNRNCMKHMIMTWYPFL